jgi:hypothetical protein
MVNLQQSVAAMRDMSNAIRRLKEEHELQGYDVTYEGHSIVCVPGAARLAYDKLYPAFNQGGFTLFRQGFEAAPTLQKSGDEDRFGRGRCA